ncbi:conserved hypothetical protein [Hyella patelloides LEGE 07179]|uniref:Ester cyclase n=1 Tax=Hyella patelloides LEGE 07179 TaxID=945734 RepID=A0A563VJU9_9CYAN|nr:ester cyclase [Hyella patelloides]VEP11709.1 conserved hypothetical protein [Hyella patelloides LEGE 07179]
MSLEQNKAISLKMYQAFDRQDVEEGKKFMAVDIVGQGMDGVTRKGVDQFVQYAISMFAVFPDGCHKVEEVIAEDDKVLTRGIFKGTHKGELMGIPALSTGQKLQRMAKYLKSKSVTIERK